MFRLLLKLIVVALLANATWHAFNVYAPHYRFKDGVPVILNLQGTVIQPKAATEASDAALFHLHCNVLVAGCTNHGAGAIRTGPAFRDSCRMCARDPGEGR